MRNFMFYSPTQFVFGRGTEERTGGLVRKFGGSRALVVYGGGSAVRSGLLDRVRQSLGEAGAEYVEMGGVQPNPTDDKVYEGIATGRREGTDFILAVGGGSVIDTAKAIAAGIPYEGDFWDFFCGKATVRTALPVGVVLTIPAAGSEGSGNSVITQAATQTKLSLRTAEELRPVFAVMNPELTFTLPAWQTACGLTDMMVHIMERYFNNTPGTAVTDRISEGLLRAIMDEGLRVIACPDDYEARADIMWAGTMAHNGICGTGCEEDWATHFMEHEVSAIYNVSHGAGLAPILLSWLGYMAERNPHKVAQLAVRVFGAEDGEDKTTVALKTVEGLTRFFTAIGMPTTLDELGVPQSAVDTLVEKLHRNKGELVGSYIPLDREATRTIFLHSFRQ